MTHTSQRSPGPVTCGGRRRVAVGLLLVLLCVCQPSGADIIDRILAVVDGALITLSDVRATIELGLLEVPADGDATRAGLDRLIERALLLKEVNRYGPRPPSPALVDEAMLSLYEGFASAGGLTEKLKTLGFSEARLREFVRDTLRISSYMEQRFPVPVPTEPEILQHYREHAREFQLGQRTRPLSEVRDLVIERWQAEKRRLLMQSWIDSLRRRADIRVLYLTPGASRFI